jgi:excinuclease UvrABC helicase subunit UvrB
MEENFDEFDMMGFHGLPDLGKPTRTEEYIDNGIRYVRSVWETKYGDIKTVYVYTTDESKNLTDEEMAKQINKTMESKGWITTAPNFERYNIPKTDNDDGWTALSPDYEMFKNIDKELNRPPTIEEKIDLLTLKLEKCVENENYERAARLRDEIAVLKGGGDVTW